MGSLGFFGVLFGPLSLDLGREGRLSPDGCVVVVEVMSLYHDPVSVILDWN